jgi:hypothetical protein
MNINQITIIGVLMLIRDLAWYSCLLIPGFIFLITISLIIFIILIKDKEISKKGKNCIKVTFVIILIVCMLILSLTLYSFYIVYIAHEPYNGWYEYNIYIEYKNENNSEIELDLPLPHDNRIYAELEFFNHFQQDRGIYTQRQDISYSFNNSEYGIILHISLNKSIYIHSYYLDEKNEINPELSLSTQQGKNAYAKLITQNQTNCNLWLWYEHTWRITFGLSFDTYTEYLSISKEPFNVPSNIPDFEVAKETDIYSKDGVKLTSGWNQLKLNFDEYHKLE